MAPPSANRPGPPPIDWGCAPEDEDEQDGSDHPEPSRLAPPPPLPSVLVRPPVPPSQRLVDLGPPPDDPMEAARWCHRMLLIQAHETAMSNIPEEERRDKVRAILRDAKGHITDAQRYDYMQALERMEKKTQSRRKGKAAAKMEKAPTAPNVARVTPIRRDNGSSN